MIYNTILDTVGRTPIVRLHTLTTGSQSEVFVKLEGANPGGSIKDRSALYIVRRAIADGRLGPDGTIVESTSGNFGKALAMIGAVMNLKVVLVVDPKMPESALEFCRAMGARIELVSKVDDKGGFQLSRLRRVQELLVEIPGAYWPDQYSNPLNPEAHAKATAQEVLEDLPNLDVLVAAVSTGGHLSGLAHGLRRILHDLEIVAVDAEGSVIFGGQRAPYLMNGIGLSWQPGNLDLSSVGRYVKILDIDAIAMCHLAARLEGLFLGASGGAVLLEAMRLARHRPGIQVLGVMPDYGNNYPIEIFDKDWLNANGLLPLPSNLDQILGVEIDHA